MWRAGSHTSTEHLHILLKGLRKTCPSIAYLHLHWTTTSKDPRSLQKDSHVQYKILSLKNVFHFLIATSLCHFKHCFPVQSVGERMNYSW